MMMKNLVWAALVLIAPLPAFALPSLSVTPGGIQSGNWVWDVAIVPDLSLVTDGTGTPVSVELGFRLTGAPLISATNINPSEFDSENPGNPIFGWEEDPPYTPAGLQVNTEEGEIFVAYGSINFETPGAKPFLQIITEGPSFGPAGLSTTIEWLGSFSGQGRIYQAAGSAPFYTTVFVNVSGSATQAVPEPACAALVAFGALFLTLGTSARQRPRSS